MKIGLIPLDERPVNTRYPAAIAAIAGAELVLPPRELLSDLRRPARCDALGAWAREAAGGLDALVVCLEMLGYGGLIASRTTDDPPAAALARLEALREIKRSHPSTPLLGFSVITRVSNADDNIEEPPYWDTYGTRLYRLSQLMDRALQGDDVAEDLDSLRAAIPAEHRRDFLLRRHRNHTVNLAAVHMLAEGALDLLVLSSDDTSPYGLGAREKRWVAELAGRLGLLDDGRLLMYPGADEVGCALVARLLNQTVGRTPRVAVRYAIPAHAEIVAPYEDGPARLTVERQIMACGAELAHEDAADMWLVVNPPVPRRSEWAPEHAAAERAARIDALLALADEVRAWQIAGRPVVVADIAYPNGADPALIEALIERGVDLPALAAYGAWNTAGNTLGTALAQGCAALLASEPEGRAAQERFLLHRFIEDWGYQQEVRRAARAWLLETTGHDEPAPERLVATAVWIEARLDALIDALPGFAGRWRIVPGSTRLPWRRLFEVDFDLEMVSR